MRISFDSNAWGQVFRSDAHECVAIRDAFATQKVKGLICETAFRIEAVRKKDRAAYFAQPHMETLFPWNIVQIDGKPHVRLMSIGPDDRKHPGLPKVQVARLRAAASAGIRLMRGLAWMGLPSSGEIRDLLAFVQETESERSEREQRQTTVSAAMWERGVGKQAFDDAGGWQGINDGQLYENKFAKACAEWADGELVAAHIGYRNDYLCTEDHGISAGTSIFDMSNRAWLEADYGVRFATLADVAKMATA